MSWLDLGPVEAIPMRGARKVKTDIGCIAVFRTGENEVYAVGNSCPHKAGPLAEGIVHGNRVTCPLHNWVISLETGEVQGADEGQVPTYPAKVEGGHVFLEAAGLARMAAE